MRTSGCDPRGAASPPNYARQPASGMNAAGEPGTLIWHQSKGEWHMDHAQCVFTANGEIQAQQVRAFLEAEGISSELRGESLRNTHGLTLDGLGVVEIVVSGIDADRARTLLASAEGGRFRLDDDAEVGSP